METKWSEHGHKTIRKIMRDILKRKIMLNFIIDSYSWWDRTYRYGHITIATLAPLVGLINIAIESSGALNVINLVLSCVVAGMVKFKEYIKFSEIRDIAKSQTIKYTQLFERIGRESIKPNAKKQPEDEFIYWINREFTHIEMVDPELSPNEKTKFLAVCKVNGIIYDDDMDLLHELLLHDGIVANAIEHVQPTAKVGVLNSKADQVPSLNNDTVRVVHIDIKDRCTSVRADTDTDTDTTPTIHRVLSIAGNPNILRSRVESDAHDRDSYKETLKKMNPKADLTWAMERLHDLDKT
jgi:hypothetical protein